ncbi:hypothetical protein C7S16_6014 [Burkholderia thailandensis]|uniref:Uncharacterized protein n=1 Tax=Burkholderia thailandensis TaxID=57975 RepID=A0AAW9CR04_BURTH|nr:hypothetical protein [Burkholderia thailandensis]MDW9252046.1 hypothetical protein [Burkholderia thailandensis]
MRCFEPAFAAAQPRRRPSFGDYRRVSNACKADPLARAFRFRASRARAC